jgi:hypothetical protein
MKHNHKIAIAFALGWLLAAVLPPTVVLGGLKSKASS